MAFVDKYDFHQLKNEAEQLVLKELERQLDEDKDDFCRCSECVLDMAGMAFNGGKPIYRSSLLGALYAAHAMEESPSTGLPFLARFTRPTRWRTKATRKP